MNMQQLLRSLHRRDNGGAVGDHIHQLARKLQLAAQLGRVGEGLDAHARQRLGGGRW